MRYTLNHYRQAIKSFHRDEAGMEAIQTVMIVAIGAIVLFFVKTVAWPAIKSWFQEQITNITGS